MGIALAATEKLFKVKGKSLRGLLKDMEVDVGECEAILREAKRTVVKVKGKS